MQKNKYAQKEEEILKFWQEKKIFERSITERPESEPYVFYDGPPFATGLPHYGHILASTVKDVFPRFHTMLGERVDRRWGWDCHGLPIENIAEKELGIKTKKEIEELGVEKFNEFCRTKVLSYAEDWKKVINRLGRWANMDHAYKTMDLEYMESVWWVFKQLWEKGLVYESYRSMHICPRCETTLSQSEVAEGYKDIKDLSVIAKFELEDEPGTYLLAWTTTPWTLLGNVALAVGENIRYVKVTVKKNGKHIGNFITSEKYDHEILGKKLKEFGDEIDWHGPLIMGSDLVGKKYDPLFEIDSNTPNIENGWKVVAADFVDDVEGTGIVHIAPAFGEDDINLGKKLDLPFIQHVGMDGIIKDGYGDFSGLSVKPADDVQSTDVAVIKYLDEKKLLFDKAQYPHSYPHCWRCETPLINYATSSWFVKVEQLKPAAINLAKDIEWMPRHIKEGRFGKWLEGARDWSISRQRYWASVIPIWVCDKNSDHKVVIGSAQELEEKSGQNICDLHKHIVDKIVFKCEECEGEMKRIPDVLDTWFDSGSMPYASTHYPFEDKENFEKCFPANFIGEGIDQTRAWFYYLHILSTAIMQKPAYKNVVVNGIILAEDGKKMSKRLNNYPDPMDIFDRFGADALRFYLMSSVVMQADNLFFNEKDLREIYNKVINTSYNVLSFYQIYKDEIKPAKIEEIDLQIIDKYILSRTENTAKAVEKAFKDYSTVKACREIRTFIDDLSLWWLRRSRERFRDESKTDRETAMTVLKYVLRKFSLMIAPLMPFMSEEIWQEIKNEGDSDSVHLALWPKVNEELIDENIEQVMKKAREIVELGHSLRQKSGLKVRQPLSGIYFSHDFGGYKDEVIKIILAELNIEMLVSSESELEAGESATIKDLSVSIETKIDARLQGLGDLREITRAIQDLRKKSGLRPNDLVDVDYHGDEKAVATVLNNDDEIKNNTNISNLIHAEDGDFVLLEISQGMLYFKLSEKSKA